MFKSRVISTVCGRRHQPVGPATYYVDAVIGSDTADGRSALNAWRSIDRVNAASLLPGDQVLFHRGDTFPGRLIPAYSGTTDAWIAFGAYGSGAAPIIDGSASSALYIAANNGNHHLRYENLYFKGAVGAMMSVVRLFSHDLTLSQCEVSHSADYIGLDAASNDGAEIYNITLDRVRCHHNYWSGAYIGSETGEFGPVNCLVTDCEFDHNGHVYDSHDHGLYVKFGVTVRNCTAHDNWNAGIKTNSQGVHTSSLYPVIEGNYCYGNAWGFYSGCVGAKFSNNLSWANTYHSIVLDPETINCEIVHNTFVNAIGGEGVSITNATITGTIFKNNIVVQDASVNPYRDIIRLNNGDLATIAANNVFDGNVYYYNGNVAAASWVDSTTRTFAQWQALATAPDAHSVYLTALPEFESRYSDLRPINGNLKGRGVALAGYNADRNGATRETPPTPGAYVATATLPPPPPAYLFDINHEGGTLAEYSSTVTNSGRLRVNASAALNGSYGLECLIENATTEYGVKNLSSTSGKVRARFYLDPNSLTMPDGCQVMLLNFRNSASVGLGGVYLYRSGGAYGIFAAMTTDSGSTQYTPVTTITDAPHYVEVYLQRASTSTASDGRIDLWVDGGSLVSNTGRDNYDYFSDLASVRFGAVFFTGGTPAGSFYLDKLTGNNDGAQIGA